MILGPYDLRDDDSHISPVWINTDAILKMNLTPSGDTAIGWKSVPPGQDRLIVLKGNVIPDIVRASRL